MPTELFSDDHCKYLIRLRESEQFRNLFDNAKNNKEKAACWNKLTAEYNKKWDGLVFTTDQIKAKLKHLRFAYTK